MVNIVMKNPTEILLVAWRRHRLLTLFTVMLLIGFVLSCIGVLADPRVITGAPRWLKPAKFAISGAIYAATLIWLLGQVTVWPRMIKRLMDVSAWLLLAEVALIDLQAARGTTSHFNVSTAFDAAIFSTMGVMILVIWAISAILFAALCRQRFESRAWGAALRAGVLLTVLGSGSGALMTSPTHAQMQGMKHAPPSTVGAHTVGGPDGGPGLPITRWSTEHGDLRVPHFLGLHGMQAIPLFAWLLQALTPWSDNRRRRLVLAGSFSYLALFILLLCQALSGASVVSANAGSMAAWVVWLSLTVTGFAAAGLGGLSHAATEGPVVTAAGVSGSDRLLVPDASHSPY